MIKLIYSQIRKGEIMKVKEKLSWILDSEENNYAEEKYKENIDFVHSLGKKCDCVGWSELDMDEPDAYEVLDKIRDFCEKKGWRARCYYKRTYEDYESDWYELRREGFKDNAFCEFVSVSDENGNELKLVTIRAYHELSHSPKGWRDTCVSDRFRKACIKNNIDDIDFCWVQDKGKYEAEQYFYIYPHKRIRHIVYDRKISEYERKPITEKQKTEMQVLGGHIQKILSSVYTLQHIELQDCYLKEDLPSGGIAYVYCTQTFSFCGRSKILIHKDTAELLIKEKVLSRSDLTPAYVVDECVDGYTLDETDVMPKPSEKYIKESFKKYEKLKEKGRPEYIVSEKDALKFFRKSKSERKADFKKKLSKKYAGEIADSIYELMLPYYNVSDGGYLSDEYEFLSYADSLRKTEEFFADLEKEEVLEAKPDGVVIAVCADGDYVLLTEDRKVIRFSHEAPEVVSEWQNIAKFFVEAINDAE